MSQIAVFAEPARAAARIIGLGLLSGGVATTAALLYRWYSHERIPEGLAVLLGVAAVAVYLNTKTALSQVMAGVGQTELFAPETALFYVGAFLVAGLLSTVGRLAGDRLATDVFAFTGVGELEGEVSQIVRTVGRVTAIELPGEIEDLDDYDPVAPDVKTEIAGTVLLFPRRLTVAELRERLVERLKHDYGVGYVGVDLDADGTINYLAVGSRAAGLGPTLGPGTVAVAVRADPAFSASPGDLVQVWRVEGDPERVLTGELRAAVDDVVTLAVDAHDASKLDPTTWYRLVTLPTEPQADRQFASLLRTADETMGIATLVEGSELAGTTVGSLAATVVAIQSAGGSVEPIPSRGRTLETGDTVYVVARPESLRRFEAAARAETAAPAAETEPSL